MTRTDGAPDRLLVDYAWSFGRLGGPPLATQLTLEPDGGVAGIDDPRVGRWAVADGRLMFVDRFGHPSFRFDPPTRVEDGRLVVAAAAADGSLHALLEAERLARLPSPDDGLRMPAGARSRRNLVLLRAGSKSLHPSWRRDVPDDMRSWDLGLSWYEDEATFRPECAADFVVFQKGRKFGPLHRLCYPGSPIFDYDFVAFPDDDIETTWRDLDRIFAAARHHDLALCQPSLCAESYVSHPITRQKPDTLLRFTGFVEVMFPVFSREALRRCAATFGLSPTDWGLDCIWPKVLGGHRHKIAILDSVAVSHRRPVGGNYDAGPAMADMLRLIAAYGAAPDYSVYGALT